MKIKIVEYLSLDHKETIFLRNKILREPIGLVYSQQDLNDEKEAVHIACLSDENQILGACFYVPYADDTIKLRQMAVDMKMQKQGVGRNLISFVETIAKQQGFSKIYLHARKDAVNFYKKLDFETIENEFIEVGIPHIEMIKEI